MGEVKVENKFKKVFENNRILIISILTLICLGFTGVQNLHAKLFDNNGRFISIKDNIPANSILLKDGRLFSPGGIDTKSKKVIPAQIYNLKTHTAEVKNAMLIPRIASSLILLNDGKVLIIGGYIPDEKGNYGGRATKYAEIFDPATETFSKTSDINYAKGFGTSCALLPDGRVFIISSKAPVEIFDPKTQKFSVIGIIKTYRLKSSFRGVTGPMAEYSTLNRFTSATPILLKNGKVLLVGNSFEDGNAEIFDPKTNSFMPTGQMKLGRTQLSATVLKNGEVIIIGGTNNYNEVSQTEIYNSETGKFRLAATLNQPRYYHSSILLPNGKVLVVGGQAGHSTTLRYFKSVEIYDPQKDKFIKISDMHYIRGFRPTLTLLKNSNVLIMDEGKRHELYVSK